MQYYNHKYTKDITAKAKTNYVPGLDWQDIAQELDIALWRGLPKFQGRNKAKERTFAQTIMRNRIIDLKKAANRQKRMLDKDHVLFSELESTTRGIVLLETGRSVTQD
jgi:DNA-directed RNA polymerase specialized sigma24 family protein